jgi:small subunit ribosomal protein S11
MVRAFSSIRPLNLQNPPSREVGRQIERRILETGTKEQNNSSDEVTGLSAITRMMNQGERNRSSPPDRVSQDYKRMAESLEANLLRHPYADRAPPYHLHIFSHKHNTIITLTRPNGNPLMSLGCGNLGFRKSQRSGYDPAYQLSSHVFGQIQEKGLLPDIQRIELVFRGFGQGRDAFIKVLLGNEGRNIRPLVTRVTDATRIKFGGTRSRKVRRLG